MAHVTTPQNLAGRETVREGEALLSRPKYPFSLSPLKGLLSVVRNGRGWGEKKEARNGRFQESLLPQLFKFNFSATEE